MMHTILKCGAALAGAALVCAFLTDPAALAGDKNGKDRPGLTGVWVQKGGEVKIQFADKNVMKIFPHGDNEVIIVVCSYTIDKHLVQAKITELEGKEKQKARKVVPVGLEFNFRWQVKDGSATLADVKGKNADALRAHLEGDYEKK